MPLIKTRTAAVAVGATMNPWQGNQYEYLPFDAMVEIALSADIVGVFASVFSGSDVLMQNSEIDQLVVTTPLTYPDDYSLSDVAAAGERLGCAITNNGAGAAIIRTAAKITPL